LRKLTLPAIFSCSVAFCIDERPIKVSNSRNTRLTSSAIPRWA
jgi:hypothetical protein